MLCEDKYRMCVTIKALIFFLIIAYPSILNAQDFFTDLADGEFNKLVLLLNENERHDWINKSLEATFKVTRKIEEIKAIDDYFKTKPDYESIKGIRAYSFLKEVNYVSLETKTDLVESLGRLLYQRKIDQEISPIQLSIETELNGLQSSQGAIQLQSKLYEYFKIMRDIENIFTNIPIKYSYNFAPAESPWDRTPKLIKVFVLHDWVSAMEKLQDNREALIDIKDSFKSFNYLRVKDPVAMVSIGCQLAVLLIAVAGYIISYTQKPSIVVIFTLVVSSMLTSLGLIFISSSTTLNLLVQALVPGSFIFYWVFKRYDTKKI